MAGVHGYSRLRPREARAPPVFLENTQTPQKARYYASLGLGSPPGLPARVGYSLGSAPNKFGTPLTSEPPACWGLPRTGRDSHHLGVPLGLPRQGRLLVGAFSSVVVSTGTWQLLCHYVTNCTRSAIEIYSSRMVGERGTWLVNSGIRRTPRHYAAARKSLCAQSVSGLGAALA
jgi:hypothetical protein